jgi:cell division protein FtsA
MEKKMWQGLDIGTTKIVAMIGKRKSWRFGSRKSKSLGVARGVVNNITQTIQSIQQAIQEAENNSGYKIKRCCSRNCGSTYTQYSTHGLHQ